MNPNGFIHCWFSGFGEGGIQAHCRGLLKAIELQELGVARRIFLKNDRATITGSSDRKIIHSFGGWPGFLRALAFAVSLIVHALQDRPVLIIVGHANFSGLARFLKNWIGTPYVVIAYGLDVWDSRGEKVATGLRRADCILSMSHFTKQKVLELKGIRADLVRILPGTLDETLFSPAPRSSLLLTQLGIPEHRRIILTVCRLEGPERSKGYDQVIRSMPAVLKSVPEAHYLIVGNGNDVLRIRNLIRQFGLEHSVTIAPFTPEMASDYYNLCDVFAMPSKMEGFGIVYLEAMACGKPVLAGNKDGSVDALGSGELGVLVDPDNVDEIAEALIRILNKTYPHAILYQPEELRKRVIEKFGFQRFAETLHQHIREFEVLRQ